MKLTCALLVAACVIASVCGHGYLEEPPARNCAWRFGYNTPVNYDDNGLNCGSIDTQWRQNGGKCGVCGDAYHLKVQENVYPGRFATKTIVREYKRGQQITLKVKMHASHKGYFLFKIGSVEQLPVKESDLHYTLVLDNESTRFQLPHISKTYPLTATLPPYLTCDHCVLQWFYRAGNRWGCENGKCGMGLGEQEHFINCADVRITN